MDSFVNLSSTPQGLAVISAAIGAAAALIAQLISGIVQLLKDLIMERVRSKRKSQLTAIYCIAELERIRIVCDEIVRKWKLIISSADIMDAQHEVQAPLLVMPSFSDLEYLDTYAATWLFHIKYRIDEIEKLYSPTGKVPPNYGGVGECRRDAYADLKIHAVHLINNIRKNYNLPKPKQTIATQLSGQSEQQQSTGEMENAEIH